MAYHAPLCVHHACQHLAQCREQTGKKDLETLAQGLLEYETLSGDEIKGLLKGKPPKRDDSDGGRTASKQSSSVPSAGAAKRGDAPDMEPQPQS